MIVRLVPILGWLRRYERSDLRPDLMAGLTVGAMLVPQGMAYALLAGLPPEIGLYAATVPVVVYACLGTSRQLAVGPVAIVSLLTATAIADVADRGLDPVAVAGLLAVLVGVVHLVLGALRMGAVVDVLSHAVLVGFTAAAAVIIAVSQLDNVLGLDVPRHEHVHDTVLDVLGRLDDVHGPTLAVGVGAVAVLVLVKRFLPRAPGALTVVIGSIVVSEVAELGDRGVATVGDIPSGLPSVGLSGVELGLVGDLITSALVITAIGFMESVAVAKVYARRTGHQIDADQELVALGSANVAAGFFGGYPVAGGFGRTAVNASAGARTPAAGIVSATVVVLAIVFLTPLVAALPTAALGAIILVAVIGLVDVREMRHIATVKRSDLVSLTVAFVATLALGVELGIVVAIVCSMLVVFVRMSRPHTAVLGRVPGTSTYRNVERFPEVDTLPCVRIVRIDAAVSFVNARRIRELLVSLADDVCTDQPPVEGRRELVFDASGVNDLDATGADMVHDLLRQLDERGVRLHLAGVKGPVRDVLHRSGLWARLVDRIHASTDDAVFAIVAASNEHRDELDDELRDGTPHDRDEDQRTRAAHDRRRAGVDERSPSTT